MGQITLTRSRKRFEAPVKKCGTIAKSVTTKGKSKLALLTPKIIDNLIRSIPKGRLVTLDLLRNSLSGKHEKMIHFSYRQKYISVLVPGPQRKIWCQGKLKSHLIGAF